MAEPLQWKEGEGYDVHLLRGGAESKRLLDGLIVRLTAPDQIVFIPRLQIGADKRSVATITTNPGIGGTTTVFDKADEIKWLWPRISKAALLNGKPIRSLSEFQFQVPVRRGHGKPFRAGDVVRFRVSPVVHGPRLDPFVMLHQSSGLVFRVKAQEDNNVGIDLVDASGNAVDVDSPNPGNANPNSWTDILLAMFDPSLRYALICPRVEAGVELRLVADLVLQHIKSNGPLTSEPGFDPGICVAASDPFAVATPTNLPFLSKVPRTLADIIGIYEGGHYHDCGVFRPAGRCKMRAAHDKTIPLCHVCRYLLVDRVDPTKHGKLDAFYPEVSA